MKRMDGEERVMVGEQKGGTNLIIKLTKPSQQLPTPQHLRAPLSSLDLLAHLRHHAPIVAPPTLLRRTHAFAGVGIAPGWRHVAMGMFSVRRRIG